MPDFSAPSLPSPLGHHYYTTFYVLAFLLNQVLLLWIGYRRGYPLRSWLLLTTGVTLAFIVGTKLLAAPTADWAALWQHGHWPAGTVRSVLGGAVGGVVAGLVLRRWLGYGWHALDAFCLPSAAAYALQCVGCLLTGCCFGHVADWGVRYAPGTLPFLTQVEHGLLPATAAYSLPVVPTQALAGLLALAVGGWLWALRARPWPGGSWRLLQAALLVAGRFALEFWRDPAGEQVGAELTTVLGLTLKQVQWALLPLLLLLGWGWWRRTRPRATAPAPEVVPASYPVRNLLGVAAMLAFTALLGPAAFTLPEVLVVKTGLTVVLAAEVLTLLRRGAAQPRRLGLPLSLASVVLLFTNQAPAPTDSATARRYLTLGLGGTQGAYDEDHVESGCGGPGSRTAYYHRYRAVGGTLEYTLRNPAHRLQALGVGLWSGSERIGVKSLPITGPFLTTDEDFHLRRSLWDINPYAEFRSRDGQNWEVGYRLGLHIGQLGYSSRALRRESSNGFQRPVQFLPDVMFWTGVRRVAYAQVDYGQGPLALGNYTVRLGVGSGLGQTRGGHLLAGLALAQHDPQLTMGFVSGQVQLGHSGLLLEPYAATDFGRHVQLNAQLRYRLPLGHR